MNDFKYNGNLGLGIVKNIIHRSNLMDGMYEITFQNDDRTLYVSHLHAFIDSLDQPISIFEITKGTKIWIDISAFEADRSLIRKKSHKTL